ncbi:MAG: hypothetical protein NLN64_02480 [Candidatus Thalassarchaeaceae archaeon]|nr:hypothetical protein [Candidatus Thalassarchaeaceae archaeon]
MVRVCVLYGTGLSNLPKFISQLYGSEITVLRSHSKWGDVPISAINDNSNNMIFMIQRDHSDDGSTTPPNLIEHRANIHASSSTNSDFIISINSVGTLSSNFSPGDIGLSIDMIDFSEYSWSFHDASAVHSDRTSIFDQQIINNLEIIIENIQQKCVQKIVVAQCNGPQFESPAEINALGKMGAEAVNMTLGPESRLISELSIPYASIIYSANWASGRNPNGNSIGINHNEIENLSSLIVENISKCIDLLINQYI